MTNRTPDIRIVKPLSAAAEPQPQMGVTGSWEQLRSRQLRQHGPSIDYSIGEQPIIQDYDDKLEDTVQICCDCGDEIPRSNAQARCVNCEEDYQIVKELTDCTDLLAAVLDPNWRPS